YPVAVRAREPRSGKPARARSPGRHSSSLVSRFRVICRFTYARRYGAHHVSAADRTITKRNRPAGITGITVRPAPEQSRRTYVQESYRSEERRVGKGGRCRWLPKQEK